MQSIKVTIYSQNFQPAPLLWAASVLLQVCSSGRMLCKLLPCWHVNKNVKISASWIQQECVCMYAKSFGGRKESALLQTPFQCLCLWPSLSHLFHLPLPHKWLSHPVLVWLLGSAYQAAALLLSCLLFTYRLSCSGWGFKYRKKKQKTSSSYKNHEGINLSSFGKFLEIIY